MELETTKLSSTGDFLFSTDSEDFSFSFSWSSFLFSPLTGSSWDALAAFLFTTPERRAAWEVFLLADDDDDDEGSALEVSTFLPL